MPNSGSFKTIRAISFLWLGSLLGAGCAFLTQIFLARLLGPNEFGIFSAAMGTVMLLAPVAGFGVAQFFLKVFGQEGWQGIRWIAAGKSLVAVSATAVVLILQFWAQIGPHNQDYRLTLIILSFFVYGTVAVELITSKFQLEERYAHVSLWQLLHHGSRLVLLVVAWYLLPTVNTKDVAVVYAVVALALVIAALPYISQMQAGVFQLKGHDVRAISVFSAPPKLWQVLRETWPYGAAGFFFMIYNQSDVVMLSYLVNSREAGIYNVAFAIMTAVYLFPAAIYQRYLLPKLHRWASHDLSRLKSVYAKGNAAMLLLGLLAAIFIWALAPRIISGLFDQRYSGAVDVLYILAAAAPVIFVATAVGAVLTTQDHMKRKIKYMFGVAISNVFANALFIPTYGAIGAAGTTLASNVLLLFLYYAGARKHVFPPRLVR